MAAPRSRIPPGRGVKVSVTVRLPADMATDARNCVRSPDHGRDPVPQNDEQCITIRTAPPAPPQEPVAPEEPHAPPVPQAPPPAPPIDTGADKKQLGPCKPGQSCLFELKFVNNGPGVWSGKAEKLTDLLPDPNVQLGTWAPSTWNCTQTGASINCEHSDATIQPGEHLSLNMTLRLPDHLSAGAQNCVVIERPEIGHIDPHLLGDRKCVTIDIVNARLRAAPARGRAAEPALPARHGQAGRTVRDALVPRGLRSSEQPGLSTTQSCPAGYELRGDKCHRRNLPVPKVHILRGKTCYPKQQQLTCPKGYVLRGKSATRGSNSSHAPEATCCGDAPVIRRRNGSSVHRVTSVSAPSASTLVRSSSRTVVVAGVDEGIIDRIPHGGARCRMQIDSLKAAATVLAATLAIGLAASSAASAGGVLDTARENVKKLMRKPSGQRKALRMPCGTVRRHRQRRRRGRTRARLTTFFASIRTDQFRKKPFDEQQKQLDGYRTKLQGLPHGDPSRAEIMKKFLEKAKQQTASRKGRDSYGDRRQDFHDKIQDYKKRTGSYPPHDRKSAPGWHLPEGASCGDANRRRARPLPAPSGHHGP